MKPAKTTIRPTEMQCPRCKAAMQFVRRIDLNELPNIHIFYCKECQHVETVKEERAA